VYLLEGNFTSYFKNRFVPEGFEDSLFLENGNKGKILVAGDGDMVKSWVDPQTQNPLPLGMDHFSDLVVANRTFLQNALQYLIDPDGIISSKTKQFEIRPLNKVRLVNQKSFWQVFNILLPVAIILAAGLTRWYIKRKKYELK